MAEYEALRRAVERLGGKPQGRRFEGELGRRLVAHVHERRAAGASLATIERELGVSGPTLRRLAREGALLPVEVVGEVAPSRPLVLRSPYGVVVEGCPSMTSHLYNRRRCTKQPGSKQRQKTVHQTGSPSPATQSPSVSEPSGAGWSNSGGRSPHTSSQAGSAPVRRRHGAMGAPPPQSSWLASAASVGAMQPHQTH